MKQCKTPECLMVISSNDSPDYCDDCGPLYVEPSEALVEAVESTKLYSAYFKDVRDLDEIDVYCVHALFQLQDTSGALHHASKKLLLSGVRTGGKSRYQDIKEARDTLNRWLDIND